MGSYALVLCAAAAVLCAFVFCMLAPTKVASRITAVCFVLIGLSGLVCFSYGYVYSGSSLPVASVRAALSTAYTFLGRNEFSAVSGTPFFQTETGIFLFWLLQMMSLYITAGAALLTVGASLLQRFRILLKRRVRVFLILGSHEEAVSFGREILEQKKTAVVFLDKSPQISRTDALRMGAILISDKNASEPDVGFLKTLGLVRGRQKIHVYALSKKYSENRDFAAALLKAMEQAGIDSARTSLTLLGQDAAGGDSHFLAGEKYGYGDVTVADEAALAARLLMSCAPPCRSISFDETGRAQKDLHCMVIGFGRLGQAVFRSVICNGQAEGSRLRVDVVDMSGGSTAGCLLDASPELERQYDIRILPCNARSQTMYRHLRECADSLDYIVVCTGNTKTNEEIAEDLVSRFSSAERKPTLSICGYDGVRLCGMDGSEKRVALYSREVLHDMALDRRAKKLNQKYSRQNGLSEEENWKRCSYFNRQSSRASAEYAPVFAWMAGKTTEEICREGWKPDAELLENLSRTEHLRWCAFHYVMGFTAMEREEHLRRSRQRAHEIQRSGAAVTHAARDLAKKTHACLCGWEELDELSREENAITGGSVDYKEMDRQNVLALGELLSAKETEN